MAFDEAEAEVSLVIESGDALNRFRGKRILNIFHQRYAAKDFPKRRTFEIELARIIAKRDDAVAPLNDFALSVIN